ncbi:MAG: serine--tRNA ligase, partial [Gammaproteobacteria bacterium]|nr:serine--tRNA ligase [Gammaproteobacteria bacterium]
SFDFDPKDHVELADGLDILDMESASKVAGPGFYYLKGDGFLLDLALQRYALDKLMAAGYVPHTVPELVRGRYMTGA